MMDGEMPVRIRSVLRAMRLQPALLPRGLRLLRRGLPLQGNALTKFAGSGYNLGEKACRDRSAEALGCFAAEIRLESKQLVAGGAHLL